MVGGHATVDWLSNNVFWTFQAIWESFEKSRWTVTREWLEVTRPSADCQTTFFRLFKQIENFLKKVAERSRDSGRRSRDCRPTVKQRFFDVSSNLGKFRKKVAERSRDSGRRSRDRRLTVKQRFLDVSSNLGKFWKKSLNGHATVVGGHATVGRLSNNVFWTFQAIWKKFWKKSLNVHVTLVGGHATVGRLSNNDFSTFQANRNFFGKSRWTVTRQWSEVTRPSADCQTTFFGRFKQFGKILKKVTERSRDSGWGHATVGRLSNNVFWTFQAIRNFFWKKSLNGHATVVGGHAAVGRLSNNDFSTFQAIRNFFEKSRWTVTRQWLRSRDRRPTVKQRFLDVSSN